MHKLSAFAKSAVIVALLSATASCTAEFKNHGYVPTQLQLSDVFVGKDNKESVATVIGQPSSAGLLNDDAWYYVQSRFRHFAYQEPKEIEREVVAVSFNARGVVTNIERFGLENSRVIQLSRRVTASSVRDTTFLRQLLGNIGQANASTLFGG